MQVLILYVESSKDRWVQDLVAEYQKKLNRFFKTEVRALKSAGLGRESAKRKTEEESKKILETLKETDQVFVCDEKGKEFDSISFSKKFSQVVETSPKRIVFIIGGAFGLEDFVKKRANHLIRLSSLTMGHQIALTVLLEQIYRAATIWKRIPYHNS